MKTLFLAAIVALAPQGQETTALSDPFLGLAFTYPKKLTLIKKTKDSLRYSVPIEGSTSTAELEIIRSPYHADKDLWQTIQLRANETLKREVVRQWEQDIIQVPMLFTQVNWTDKGTPKTSLSGLFYTQTPQKMLVRLTAPATDFPTVQTEFQSSLESLHTLDGSQPKEDDINVKFDPTKKPEPAPLKPTIISGAGAGAGKLFKGPVAVPITVSTKPAVLHLPEGWSATDVADGQLKLTHSKISTPILVEVRSVLDSEAASTALNKRASTGLAAFAPGPRRVDTAPASNRAGCAVGTVWRTGKGATEGELYTFDASALQGDFYLLASYKSSSATAYKQDKELIRTLFEGISIENGQP